MMLNSSFGANPPAALVYNLNATVGALTGATITTSTSFNGSTQRLSTNGGTGTAMSTGNFTWECWVRPTASVGYQTFIETRGTKTLYSAVETDGAYFGLDNGTLYPIYYSGGVALITSSIAVTLNAWTHVALVRSSGTTTLYVGGVSGGTYADSIDFSAPYVNIGGNGSGDGLWLTGQLSNLRMVKGSAVYTTTFTPPTATLVAISGTQLLLPLATNSYIDDSSNMFVMTNTGTVTTTASAPSLTAASTDFTGTYSLTLTNAAPSITWSSGSGGVFNKTGSNTTDLIKGGPNYTSSSQSYTVFLAYQLQPVSSSVGNGRILATASEATNDWLLGSYAPGTPNSPMYFNSFYPNADMGYNVDAYDTGWRFIWGTYNGTTGVSTKFIASSTVNNTSGPTSAYKTSTIGVGSHGFNQLRLWNRSAGGEPATGNIGFVKVYNGVCSISQIQSQWSAYHSRFGI